MDLDEDCHLRNIFWADAKSKVTSKEFGDVITFDLTYLTNKYYMSFYGFIEVNHHCQSTLFGFGFISREDIDTYIRLFKS